jgi:hypothetical protein
MATETWVGGNGVGLTWTACMLNSGTSVLNSITNNDSVLDGADVTNGTALDIYADFSVQLGSVTSVAPAMMNVFIYPLNGDGSTYGDNQLTTTFAAKTPAPQFYAGSIIFPVGTQALIGTLERIVMPPGTFRWAVQSQAGVTLASSGNAAQYRTYNRKVA